MKKKSNAAIGCHVASTVSKKHAHQRYDPGDLEIMSRDFKTFMQTYHTAYPNAFKYPTKGLDRRCVWPACIQAFITAYPRHAYVNDLSRTLRWKVLGALKAHGGGDDTHDSGFSKNHDSEFSKIAESFFAVDNDQESIQDIESEKQAKKRRLEPNATRSSLVGCGLDFPERLFKFINENKEMYTTDHVDKIPAPIPGESEWIASCLARIHNVTGIESRQELLSLFLDEYPALSHLKRMNTSTFDSRYKPVVELIMLRQRQSAAVVPTSVKEPILLHQRQHTAVVPTHVREPITGMQHQLHCRAMVPVNTALKSPSVCNINEFPDRLFKIMDDKKNRYTTVRIPRPIPGETEWMRCCLVDIRHTTGIDSWKKLIELFVKEYPRLSHLLKMDINVFQNRFGAVRNLLRDSLNETQIMMLDHRRSQRRVSRHHESQSSQSSQPSQSSHPGSGADSTSLQDPSLDNCHGIESEQMDLASPQISMNLEDLSPAARDDIKSALYGQVDTSVDVAVQPARSVARRSPRFKTLGFESGLNFQDSDIQVGGAPGLFDNSPVPSPGIPTGSIYSVFESEFDSERIAAGDTGTALFESPGFPSPGPRRSPRFTRPRANTPQGLELRRSPRLKKPVGKLSFP